MNRCRTSNLNFPLAFYSPFSAIYSGNNGRDCCFYDIAMLHEIRALLSCGPIPRMQTVWTGNQTDRTRRFTKCTLGSQVWNAWNEPVKYQNTYSGGQLIKVRGWFCTTQALCGAGSTSNLLFMANRVQRWSRKLSQDGSIAPAMQDSRQAIFEQSLHLSKISTSINYYSNLFPNHYR